MLEQQLKSLLDNYTKEDFHNNKKVTLELSYHDLSDVYVSILTTNAYVENVDELMTKTFNLIRKG